MFKSDKGNKVRVDHFRDGKSYHGYIKFVNSSSGLSVFGDFGNWIFNRQFHPSDEGYVSAGYWNEKLKMSSCQEHAAFDSEETCKELQEGIDGGLEEYGYEGDNLVVMKEWYEELQSFVDDELEYTYNAYRNQPSGITIDYEDVPLCKKGSVQLQIIFDAFDEICRRLKATQ